jgi:hypothetical protein
MMVAATIIGPVALAPEMSSAEGLLDFFFGQNQKQQPQPHFRQYLKAALNVSTTERTWVKPLRGSGPPSPAHQFQCRI